MSIIPVKHGSDEYWKRRIPPPYFYRTFHENSHTSTRYDLKHCQAIRVPNVYNKDNAFQARNAFDFESGLIQSRIRAHLEWGNDKEPFSCFISVFETLGRAEQRAREQFLPQERVSVAKIKNRGLKPALYRRDQDDASQAPSPDIPIWIEEDSIETAKNVMPINTVVRCQADIWLSKAEIRKPFSIPNGVGQDNEWLACGRIPVSRVEQIMPYNAEGLFEKPHLNVTSGSYIFDFQHQIWLPKTLRIHDRKAAESAQGRWRMKLETLRQEHTQMKRLRTKNCQVTASEISSLYHAVHDLRDAASLIADYYESVGMTAFGRESLDDEAKFHHHLSLWCSVACKEIEADTLVVELEMLGI